MCVVWMCRQDCVFGMCRQEVVGLCEQEYVDENVCGWNVYVHVGKDVCGGWNVWAKMYVVGMCG